MKKFVSLLSLGFAFAAPSFAASQADANRQMNNRPETPETSERSAPAETRRAARPFTPTADAAPVGSLCVEALRHPENTNPDFLAQCQERRRSNRAIAANGGAPKRAELSCELKAPHLIPGCQGEDCSRVGTIASRALDLYAEPAKGAKKIGKLKQGERIRDPRVVMEVRRYGRARIKEVGEIERDAGLREGDEVSYAAYGMLGSAQICLGRELASIGTEDRETWQETRAPVVQEWIRVTTAKGKQGYVLRGGKREPFTFSKN